jgi:hypothetical protein
MNRTQKFPRLRAALHRIAFEERGEVAVPQYPLDPPTVSGNRITVDLMLQNPTRITRMIRDLTLQRFIADRIFTSGGGVTGGALVYDQATANELYLTRDVEEVTPGSEHPIVTDERQVPKVEPVRKYGGKTFITDEARDRNQTTYFTQQVTKLANTIVRKINARAVEVLESAVASHSRTVTGNNWATGILEGATPTAPADRPTADFAAAALEAETRELGYVYDTWIVNPQELTNLVIMYGDKLNAVLDAAGVREMYASNRVTAGTAYAVAAKQVGEMRIESPLKTETDREGAPRLGEKTWVQSNVRPVMVVTDPYALLKFTGLAG